VSYAAAGNQNVAKETGDCDQEILGKKDLEVHQKMKKET